MKKTLASVIFVTLISTAAVMADTETSSTSIHDVEDPAYIPEYQRVKPRWGMQLDYGSHALGGASQLPYRGGGRVKAYTAQFDYQPESLQRAGVIGFGPTASVYSPSSTVGQDVNLLTMWSAGFQLRYQARFLHEQILVPFAGLSAEFMHYAFKGGPNGGVLLKGPSLGAMILLSPIDTSMAEEFYNSTGGTRTYLLTELRMLSASNKDLAFSGASLFFGFRAEFR